MYGTSFKFKFDGEEYGDGSIKYLTVSNSIEAIEAEVDDRLRMLDRWVDSDDDHALVGCNVDDHDGVIVRVFTCRGDVIGCIHDEVYVKMLCHV